MPVFSPSTMQMLIAAAKDRETRNVPPLKRRRPIVTSTRFFRWVVSLVTACVLAGSGAGCGGLNIDWTGDGHTVVDPNPPGVVVQPAAVRVLIVEETADRPSLPGSQVSIFTSTKLDAYMKAHCTPLADGSSGFVVVDKDDLKSLLAEFKAAADSPRESTPWLYVTNGKAGLSCPLPGSVDELIEKVGPYVGEGGK